MHVFDESKLIPQMYRKSVFIHFHQIQMVFFMNPLRTKVVFPFNITSSIEYECLNEENILDLHAEFPDVCN